MCNNLVLNPHAIRVSSDNPTYIPPSSVQLLSTLRERLTRFQNFTPKSETEFYLAEQEGRLYEYLEGHLMRSVGSEHTYSSRIAFYDLNKLDDWEDVDDDTAHEVEASASTSAGGAERTDGPQSEAQVDVEKDLGESIRRFKNFGFHVNEFAIDPGQDLLVLVEMRCVRLYAVHFGDADMLSSYRSAGAGRRPGQWSMHLHLLSLSTYEPHPRARNPCLDWPFPFQSSSVQLAFQICDDGLFVMSMNQRREQSAQLTGWQWTTGWRAIVSRDGPRLQHADLVRPSHRPSPWNSSRSSCSLPLPSRSQHP